MAATENPVFYDCEASGLEGFPIEIGWSFIEPVSGAICCESHFIQPPPGWNIEATWDFDAEILHQIALGDLVLLGKPPTVIARRMNAVLEDRNLYSDSGWDEVWLRSIFDDAGFDPQFTIHRTDARVLINRRARQNAITDERLVNASRTVDRLMPRTHRAADDARHLTMLWRMADNAL